MTTWADLRVGDVVQARTGGMWRVDERQAVTGTRWLAAGGGRRELLFTLSVLDGSRPPITATHPLSDPVNRVFTHDHTADDTALSALRATFDEVTMISEGEPMTSDVQTVSAGVQPSECKHHDHELSTLKDGRIYCTACFTTVGDANDPVADDGLAHAAGLANPVGAGRNGAGDVHPPQCACPRPECAALALPPGSTPHGPPVACTDASGTEYLIPADQVNAACHQGIHPVACRTWDGEQLSGCSSCGLVFPAGLDAQPAESVATAPESPVAPVAPAVPAVVVTDRPAGPAPTADLFADPAGFIEVKRDRWGRYVLPHPETGVEQPWVRASTLARCLADEYHLNGWKMRQVARGVSLNKDLIAGVVAADPEDKGTLDKLVGKAMERAESSSGANLGTALHSFTHRLDRGEPIASLRAPAPLDADLVEYLATLKRYGLGIVPDLIERIVVCPELGVAGTFDRIVTQHPGYASGCRLSVLDLKTGKSVEHGFLEMAIQQAIYNHATHMWNPITQSYVPMPPPSVLDRDRALILHLPVGQAHGDLYGVNTIEGFEAARVAEQVRQYRNAGKGYGWLVNPADHESLLVHRVSTADGSELSRLWEKHYPLGEWTPAVAQAAEARVARLQVVPVG